MEYSKTFVYQELNINNATSFLWFKLAEEDSEDYIIPDKLLTLEEHLLALTYD